MKNSSSGTIITVLVAMVLIFLSLVLFQSAWLKLIQYMLNSNQPSGLPVSSTSVTGFSFPKPKDPVRLGMEQIVNHAGITVTRVVNPAPYVANASKYISLKQGEQYLLVDIKVRCISTTESCRLTEFDFGIHSKGGQDYPAELSLNYSDLKGLFNGGEIKPGNDTAGSLIFIIQTDDHGLTLVYPRLYSFGGAAEFLLDQ